MSSGHASDIISLAFSPDGQRIASGSCDKTVRVWDAETGAALFNPLEGHTGAVSSVAFSPNRQRIVSGSYDMTVHVWDAETGAMLFELLEGHTRGVTSVVFSPDSRCIVRCASARATAPSWTSTSMSSRPPLACSSTSRMASSSLLAQAVACTSSGRPTSRTNDTAGWVIYRGVYGS